MRLLLDLNVNGIRLLERQPVPLLPLLWAALLAQHLGLCMTEAGLERRSPCDQLLPKPGAAGGSGRLGAAAAAIAAAGLAALAGGESGAVGPGGGEPVAGGGGVAAELLLPCPLEGLVSCSPLSREAQVLHEEDLPRLNPHRLLASESQNRHQPLPNDRDHLARHGEDGDTKSRAPRLIFRLQARRSDCLQ